MRAPRSASLDADVRQLANVRPFDKLPREALQLLAFSAQKRRLAAGEALFAAGERADSAFLVLEGEIAMRRPDGERCAGVGALIGESALLVETIRPADAAATRDSRLLDISRETFRRVLSEFPDDAVEIHRAAATRAHTLIGKLEAIRRRAFPSSPAA